jgi:hypothetical protein
MIPFLGVRWTFFTVAAVGILGGLAGLTSLVHAAAPQLDAPARPALVAEPD